jgi:tetratricopeptide (TPR) repeat protein
MNTTFSGTQTGRFGRREYFLAVGLMLILMVMLVVTYQPALAVVQDETPACDSSTDYIVEGEANIISGDYDLAAAAYECAIEIDPANYLAYFWRGGLAAGNQDYDQLGNDLYAFFSHRTGVHDPMRLSIVKSIAGLSSAIQARPDDAKAYLLRGLTYVIAGIDAQTDFNHVIELAPDNAAGYLFYWLNSNPVASADFEDEKFLQGSELAGDSILVDWIRSFAAIDITSTIAEDNIPYFDTVIEWHPDHPFAFAARGMAYAMLGDSAPVASDYYQHIQNNQTEVVDEPELELGTQVDLDAVAGTVYNLPFTATAGQTLNVSAARIDGGLFFVFPLTYVVLDPAGQMMTPPYSIQVSMGSTFTSIVDMEIPEDGTYTVVLAPNYSGPINLAVWEG